MRATPVAQRHLSTAWVNWQLFVSNGKTDHIATVAAGKAVGESANKEFGAVRIETFEGGHTISQEQLKSALAWSAEPGKPSGK